MNPTRYRAAGDQMMKIDDRVEQARESPDPIEGSQNSSEDIDEDLEEKKM